MLAIRLDPGALAATADGEALFAFANASPLTVVDSPGSKEFRKEEFEFGSAYLVEGQEGSYLRLKLKSGRVGYVRVEEVTTVRNPRWLSSTPAYNGSERPRTPLWDDPARLREFLAGAGSSRADYEESFTDPPQFRLKLPILESDDVSLRGGGRRIRYVCALLPVSREERQAFESAKADLSRQLSLHLLLDVSGSTTGFLEPAIRDFIKAIGQNEQLRKRVSAASVITFGADRKSVVSNLGKLALKQIGEKEWHARGDEKPAIGDSEPLVDALAALAAESQADSADSSVILVFSGADVQLHGVATTPSTVSIEDLKFPAVKDMSAILAQITPEPGQDLREAARRWPEPATKVYVAYSRLTPEALAGELARAAASQKSDLETLELATKAAHQKQMMAFFPDPFTPTSSLPSPQPYAADADWFAVRLCLVLNDAIWTETTQ